MWDESNLKRSRWSRNCFDSRVVLLVSMVRELLRGSEWRAGVETS